MGHSRNSRTRILKARRGIEAMKLRESGLTYQEIGQRMGISEQRAWKLVCEEFDRLNSQRSEKAGDVLRLELSRLDEMFSSVWDRARGGDLKAIGAALKIVEKRADLLGLKLVRHEVKVNNEHTINISARIDEYAQELDRALAPQQFALPCGAESHGGRKSLDQAGTDQNAEPLSGI